MYKITTEIVFILDRRRSTKKYTEREFADYYKSGSLKILERALESPESTSPPWIRMIPTMNIYEERGARLLSKSLWKSKCYVT